jgi:hypothetical protein
MIGLMVMLVLLVAYIAFVGLMTTDRVTQRERRRSNRATQD